MSDNIEEIKKKQKEWEDEVFKPYIDEFPERYIY